MIGNYYEYSLHENISKIAVHQRHFTETSWKDGDILKRYGLPKKTSNLQNNSGIYALFLCGSQCWKDMSKT